ncbi:MAG TPA: AAA family ATPase [Armatimonadetes bacterium]|nr:AAA family ATPase [Armatimonadota bacterium]
MTVEEAVRELSILIKARYPIIYIVSPEEERVEAALREAAGDGRPIIPWSITLPFSGQKPQGAKFDPFAEVSEAMAALDRIEQEAIRDRDSPAIYLLKDFDQFMDDPAIVRKLRELAMLLKRTKKTLVILSPVLRLPPHLEKDITVFDFPLPSIEELRQILERLVRAVQRNPNVVIDLNEPDKEALVKAALGLTASEAENVFAKALVKNRRLDAMNVEEVLSEKKQIIRKTGLLEFFPAEETLSDVGGLDLLKAWIRKRKKAFSERARRFGLPEPKGVLLLGVPGCGKSLCAKVVAKTWGLPLLRFDVGRVFGRYVGESEENMRKALRTAETLSPCVLWIDEVEKAFSGTGGTEDAGTAARVFGTFLTWLQEKRAPVFVVATANDISALPPELLRKGRLDEVFFVDLPSKEERREIFAIHLRKRGRNPKEFDLDLLAERSKGFSGAEIEAVVIGALYDAFDEERDLSTEDLLRNIEQTVPLSQTMREEIEALREWARMRARPASSKPPEPLEDLPPLGWPEPAGRKG